MDVAQRLGAVNYHNKPSLEIDKKKTSKLAQPNSDRNSSSYGLEAEILKALCVSLIPGEAMTNENEEKLQHPYVLQ